MIESLGTVFHNDISYSSPVTSMAITRNLSLDTELKKPVHTTKDSVLVTRQKQTDIILQNFNALKLHPLAWAIIYQRQ